MLGNPGIALISEEAKAEHSAQAITEALNLPAGDVRDDIIYRNAKHLSLVIDSLDITTAKRTSYQKLITDYLVD